MFPFLKWFLYIPFYENALFYRREATRFGNTTLTNVKYISESIYAH